MLNLLIFAMAFNAQSDADTSKENITNVIYTLETALVSYTSAYDSRKDQLTALQVRAMLAFPLMTNADYNSVMAAMMTAMTNMVAANTALDAGRAGYQFAAFTSLGMGNQFYNNQNYVNAKMAWDTGASAGNAGFNALVVGSDNMTNASNAFSIIDILCIKYGK